MNGVARTFPPLPPRDELLTLFRTALANAQDLLSDADILLNARRWPRAHALATLAWEELGKAHLCLIAVTVPSDVSPEDFWGILGDHGRKLVRMHGFAALIQPGVLARFPDIAKKVQSGFAASNDLRLRGLFVDYSRGRILLPSSITEKQPGT